MPKRSIEVKNDWSVAVASGIANECESGQVKAKSEVEIEVEIEVVIVIEAVDDFVASLIEGEIESQSFGYDDQDCDCSCGYD